MRALCIQPPFVQLNAPYPAVWYLDAWFRKAGLASSAEDHSIAVTRALYGREGLLKVFAAAKIAIKGKKRPEGEAASRLSAYFEQEERYVALADGLLGYLSGGDPSFAYRLAVGAGLPLGMRAEAVLGEQGGIAAEDAPALATAILNDLTDFLGYALDEGFGAVRYAERLASGARDYSAVSRAAEGSWVLGQFYRPLLKERYARLKGELEADLAAGGDGRAIICVSAPFPGCLAGALLAAEEAKEALGGRATTLLGGGYVSTELRFLTAPELFDRFDYLCYDAGYAALASILAALSAPPLAAVGRDRGGLCRVRYRDESGAVIAAGFPADEACRRGQAAAASRAVPAGDSAPGGATASGGSGGAADAAPESADAAAREGFERSEREAIASVHPDYAGADFSAYLRIVDSPNPMHRLWNDTPWLKYRLAYGCYWKRCAFCDTELDYIKRYLPSDLNELMAAADAASARTGLYGIHFTDEAMPINLVRQFAQRNRERARPFSFWGNVRFDRSWTEEACAMAAEGGLIAVSGGIEIATGKGLEIVDKGFSLSDLIRSLVHFKRAGILTHAYLIYGFPGQSDQDIADSAEMVRALLSEGLVDSAFWHKFVLTRHSRIYARWERGEVPALSPIVPPSRFAVNDLRFKGEEYYDRWTAPLDAALAAWADRGELELPLAAFLPKGLPKPKLDAKATLAAAGIR
jgi:hypothetical protein